MAKNVYAAEVTGVCGPTNVDMVKEIGADFVIDYTKEDYTKSDSKYDIILDVVSAKNLSKCKNILASEGTYISNNPISSPKNLFHMMTNNKKFKTGTADESATAMNLLREWIEEGKIKPVIDKVYPLNQTAAAHRHYETGHAKGRVVISIE
jgi:NADPH2:quinone reductase